MLVYALALAIAVVMTIIFTAATEKYYRWKGDAWDKEKIQIKEDHEKTLADLKDQHSKEIQRWDRSNLRLSNQLEEAN
ncbi:MAG: hypothetical protein ACK56I_11410, partial [bacterium]